MSETVRAASLTAGATVLAALISSFVAFKIAGKSAKEEVRNQFNLKLVPVGSIITFSGDINNPVLRRELKENGWLFCDGGEIPEDRAFDHLRMVLKNTFGNNKLPDLRGRAVVGAGHGNNLTLRTIGQMYGKESHVLTVAEMPSHNHELYNVHYSIGGWPSGSIPTNPPSGISDGKFLQVGYAGSGQPHNIMQPSIVLNFIIKAK